MHLWLEILQCFNESKAVNVMLGLLANIWWPPFLPGSSGPAEILVPQLWFLS